MNLLYIENTLIARKLPWMLLAGALAAALLLPVSASAAPSGTSHAGRSTGAKVSTAACDNAAARVVKARHVLRKLRRDGAPASAIRKVRHKLNKAGFAANAACRALFDITAVNGKFDVTNTRDDIPGCTFVEDAHWTTSLGSGVAPAKLELLLIDRKGKPAFSFSSGDPLVVAHGTGVATRTCDRPDPGSSGTASCDFNVEKAQTIGLQSDTGAESFDPLTLDWGYTYSGIGYGRPENGGSCTSNGPRPPSVDLGEASPGLDVNQLNDGTNVLQPMGITTVPASTFAGDTTLNIGASGSASFGGHVDESWSMAVTLHRR